MDASDVDMVDAAAAPATIKKRKANDEQAERESIVPKEIEETQLDNLLFFDSFAFEFAIPKRWEEEGNECHSLVEVTIGNEEIRGITTHDPRSDWARRGKQLWLLLTRHVEEDIVLHNFILLKPTGGGIHERADMLRLNVPVKKLSLLAKLGLHRLQGVLI